jgi:hypothetical protein
MLSVQEDAVMPTVHCYHYVYCIWNVTSFTDPKSTTDIFLVSFFICDEL